jgi:hemin uptake protein HemP
MQPDARRPPAPPPAPAPGARPPAEPIESRALLAGAREVRIRHGDAIYRLQVTALGKLILTK